MAELAEIAEQIRARLAEDGFPSVRDRLVVRFRAVGRSAEACGRAFARVGAAAKAFPKGDV